jgi:Flp pilus assembly protein TadB
MVLDPGAVLTASMAALSAGLWFSDPAAQLTRAGRTEGEQPKPGRGGAKLLAARPDASPLRRRVLIAVVGAVTAAVGLTTVGGAVATAGWLAMPLLAATGVILLGKLEPAQSQRRSEQLVVDLPQGLELLAACLAAGMPLRQATRAVAEAFAGPVGEDLSLVLSQVDVGFSDAEAWRSMRGHPQWGPAAIDLARSVESGTMMVQVLRHHARAGRELRRAALEVRAKAVGVRSVLPLMTCFLPAFLLLGIVPTVASAVSNALS